MAIDEEIRSESTDNMANKPLNAKERDLVRAVGNEDVDAVRRLIEEDGVNVNIQDSLQRTPILRACFVSEKSNRTVIGQLLLDNGADINLTERHGRTALMTACMEDGKEDMVALIMTVSNVDANRQDESGNTAIMHAVLIDNVEAVRVLLSPENKTKVNSEMKNFEDKTPLLVASKQQNAEICELLVREGGASHQDIPSFFKKYLPEECQDGEQKPKPSWNSLFKSYRDNSLEPNIIQRSAVTWQNKSKKKGEDPTKKAEDPPAAVAEATDNGDARGGTGDETPQNKELKDQQDAANKDENDISREAEGAEDATPNSKSQQEEKKDEKHQENQMFFKVDPEIKERRNSRRRSGGEELAEEVKQEQHTTSSTTAARTATSAKFPRRSTADSPPPSQKHDDVFVSTSPEISNEKVVEAQVRSEERPTQKSSVVKEKETIKRTERKEDARNVTGKVIQPTIVSTTAAEVQHAEVSVSRDNSRENDLKREERDEIISIRNDTAKSSTSRVGKEEQYIQKEAKRGNGVVSTESPNEIEKNGDVRSLETVVREKQETQDVVLQNKNEATPSPKSRVVSEGVITKETVSSNVVENNNRRASPRSPRNDQTLVTEPREKERDETVSGQRDDKRNVLVQEESKRAATSKGRPVESRQSQKTQDMAKSSASLKSSATVRSTKSMRSVTSKTVSEGDTVSLAPTESSMKKGTWIRPPPDMIKLQEEADEAASQKGRKSRKKVKVKKEDQPVYETKSGRIIRPNVCSDPQYVTYQASKLKIVEEEPVSFNKEDSGGKLSGPSYEKGSRKPKRKPQSDSEKQSKK